MRCHLLPDIGLGHNYMVRIVQFEDGVRWVARLRMPPVATPGPFENWEDSAEAMKNCEYNTISLVRQVTSIPIPKVHTIETRQDTDVRASFMLMDMGMDLGMKIPPEYKQGFLRRLAQIYVSHSFIFST